MEAVNVDHIIKLVRNMKDSDKTNCVETSENIICVAKEMYHKYNYKNDITDFETLKQLIIDNDRNESNGIYKIHLTIRDGTSMIFNHSFIIIQGNNTYKICDSWEGIHTFHCHKGISRDEFTIWFDILLKLLIDIEIINKFEGVKWNDFFELTNDKWNDELNLLKEEGEWVSSLPIFTEIIDIKNPKIKISTEIITGFSVKEKF